MNRQSNVYTFVYALVLVLVVGVALSLVYQVLRPKQVENIANDTRRQILAAALITPTDGQSISELWDAHITDSFIVNSKGDRIDDSQKAEDIKVMQEVKKPEAERLLPVFVCRTDAAKKDAADTKYILPVYGAGLWGPIWGYLAINSDGTTIYGAYFAHQGETPGLGAEIEKPAFQKQFEGKSLYADGQFTSIQVVKPGKEPSDRDCVHAISGGTITSTGVQSMLENSLAPYNAFLMKLQQTDKQ